MREITPEKTHKLLEKLADYVMNEVPRKSEVPTKQEMNARFEQVDRRFEQVDRRFDQVEQRLDHVESVVQETKKDVKLILDGMDSQIKEGEILKTEQVAIKSGLRRVEKRVDVLEKKVG
jgi:polyphosphate kinase 2 (PPK2 family)